MDLQFHIPCRPSIVRTLEFLLTVKADHICHAQYSSYIAATHNITHSLKCTIHPPLPTPLPSTTLCTQLTNTKHVCVSGGKRAQDVGMVWKRYGGIPI